MPNNTKPRTLAEIIARRMQIENELKLLTQTMAQDTVEKYIEERKRLHDERGALVDDELRIAGMD